MWSLERYGRAHKIGTMLQHKLAKRKVDPWPSKVQDIKEINDLFPLLEGGIVSNLTTVDFSYFPGVLPGPGGWAPGSYVSSLVALYAKRPKPPEK